MRKEKKKYFDASFLKNQNENINKAMEVDINGETFNIFSNLLENKGVISTFCTLLYQDFFKNLFEAMPPSDFSVCSYFKHFILKREKTT